MIKVHSSDRSVKVDICGSEDGHQVAWVTVNVDGTVTFLNQQGLTSSCSLDNGLSVGSQCTVSEITSGHSSTPATAISILLFILLVWKAFKIVFCFFK